MVAVETARPTVAVPISTAQQFRDRYRPTVPDMIDDHQTGSSLLCAISGTNITIQPGGAIVQGHRYDNTAVITLAALAAGAADVIQSVVLTYDISHTPPIYCRIIAGTSGGGVASLPFTSSLTGVWDFPLCHFTRQPAGTLTAMTDRRIFSAGDGSTVGTNSVFGTLGVGWFPIAPRIGQTQRWWGSGDTYLWNGSNWILLSRGQVALPAQVADATTVTPATTSYAVGSPVLSATLVASSSAAMFITIEARGSHPTTNQAAFMSFEVRDTNSVGAIILGASDDRACIMSVPNNTSASYRYYLSGLNVLTTYYVQTLQRSSDTTGAPIVIRQLILEPAR